MNTTHMKNTTGLIRKWFTRGVACMALLFAGQSAYATTYIWANSNVNGATPASLNWFAATQGTWTGGTPVSDNLNTIQFFQDATTLLSNTGGDTQASVIDNGGSAFQLGTLTLSGKGGSTSASNLVMTISGDALNFSALTGTINLDATNGSRVLTPNVNSAIQLGTASSASALTLTGNGNANFVISGVISELQLGGGSLTKSGTSTVRLSGANTYTGTTTINGGTLFLGNAGANGSLSTSSAIVVNSGTFTIARNNAVTQGTDFSGAPITGAGGFTQSGGTTGTTTLNAANTYTGVTTISGGVLAFATAADGGLPSNLGQSSSAAANLVIGGTSTTALKYTGTGGSTDRLFTINNVTYVSILDASGTGAINFYNTGAIAYGTVNQVRTLQLQGSNTGTNTLAALIQDNGTGKVSINKAWNGGAGTWVITGNNTYTGSTTLGDGTVIVTSLKNIGTPSNLGAGGTISFGSFNPAGTLKYQGTGDETDRAINFAASGGGSVMTIDQSGTGLLKFTGTFTMTGASDGKSLRLQGSSAGTGEMQSILVDNSPANRLNVTKAGTGTWTLSGTNTYTGATSVSAGTLTLTGTLGSGGGTAITVNGATANFNESSAGVIAGTSSFTLTTGSATLAGANTYNGTTTINGGTLALTGSNNSSGATTLSSTGTLSLGTGTNNGLASGLLSLNGGTIQSTDNSSRTVSNALALGGNVAFGGTGDLAFTDTTAVTLAATRTLTVNNTNTSLAQAIGGATFGLTKAGTGTLTLTGNNTYTGATTVNSGTLLLDMTTGALDSTSALTLGGGNFQVKGKTGAFTTAQTLGALTLTADTGSTITLDPNGGTSTILTLGNSWTRGSGASLLIDYSSANTGTRQVVTTGATTGLTLGNGIYGTILVKDAAGVTGFATRAAGSNQAITRYDDRDTGAGGLGTTLVNNSATATINYTTLNTVYTAGTLSWNNGITTRSVNSLTIDTTNTGGTIDMGAPSNILTLTGAAILFRGANNAILQGGQVGAAASGVIVHQTGAGTLTINSFIGSGATKLVKDGTGTLVLGANNTYTGTTIINAGTLKLGATGSGANGPLGTIAGSTTVTGTGAALDLGGVTLATAEPLTLKGTGIAGGGALMNSGSAATYSGLITLGSDASIVANNDITLSNVGTITGAGFGLTLAGTSSDSKLASIIGTGAGTVTKSGSGTWTLSANNTYSGATMINEGTLVGVVGGSCSNSAVTVASAGALGISVTDPNKKWSCASLALNSGSQLKFDFTGTTPSASEAPLNILGNLTFSETSTIVVSPRTTTPGTYPLLTVGGTAPTSSLPKLSGVTGKLFWNDKTLWVTIVPSGTMIRFL